MTPEQVVIHFGRSQVAAARAIGCNQSSISDWVKAGFVPSDWQHYIERLSGGQLKVDPEGIIRRIEAHVHRRRPEVA